MTDDIADAQSIESPRQTGMTLGSGSAITLQSYSHDNQCDENKLFLISVRVVKNTVPVEV